MEARGRSRSEDGGSRMENGGETEGRGRMGIEARMENGGEPEGGGPKRGSRMEDGRW
jgi:hypothetical protein